MAYRAILLAGALSLAALTSAAEDTLPSFSLTPQTNAQDAPQEDTGNALSDCLVSASDCEGQAVRGRKQYTLDDLVNIGVIDNPPPAPAPTAAPDGEPAAAGERAVRVPVVQNEEPLPSIDLDILFAYNADEPLPTEWQKIRQLADALSDPRLSDRRFLIVGHTDAAGSDDYNQRLSERRAAAVRQRLLALAGLPSDRLTAVGRGEMDLALPFAPRADENRRVQIVMY